MTQQNEQTKAYFNASVHERDPLVAGALDNERKRQQDQIELIASENIVSRAVLEVRSHEVPFILEHGQIIGRLVYEHMLHRPHALYGTDLGSNYQAQGLKLSKHFR